ncbi:MAG: DUF3343 domain-containing protein [Eubacterium sp.]|nr:DUF3343 domain-containing protein [Eubacterium sp.]
MEEERINYYILFEDYTQGLLMQELLRGEQIKSRIAPTPHAIQGSLGCGMSLLIQPEDLAAVKRCIACKKPEYYDIVPLPCQIQPNRNKFC